MLSFIKDLNEFNQFLQTYIAAGRNPSYRG